MDATHPGEWWIHGNSDPRVPWGDLILADGGRIHFTRISPGDTDPYVATAEYVVENGSIVQSRLDEGDGLEIRRYKSQHYITSETLYADSVRPIMFAYDLDPRSNVQTGAVMTCAGVAGPVRRTVQVAERLDDMTKQNLMRESCLPPR